MKKALSQSSQDFIAANQDGIVTTVGRGGSDYTATILGVALQVDEVWIWTDVDGIMTTDPKIVPSARMLPQLSYQEAAEMAIFGAKAMHPRALGPVIKENIPVRIRNTIHPENHGTLITKEPNANVTEAVKAVAMIKDVAMLNVYGAGNGWGTRKLRQSLRRFGQKQHQRYDDIHCRLRSQHLHDNQTRTSGQSCQQPGNRTARNGAD